MRLRSTKAAYRHGFCSVCIGHELCFFLTYTLLFYLILQWITDNAWELVCPLMFTWRILIRQSTYKYNLSFFFVINRLHVTPHILPHFCARGPRFGGKERSDGTAYQDIIETFTLQVRVYFSSETASSTLLWFAPCPWRSGGLHTTGEAPQAAFKTLCAVSTTARHVTARCAWGRIHGSGDNY